MDLLHIPPGWFKPALGMAIALTMAAPFAPAALACEQHQSQPLQDRSPLKEQTTQFVPEDHKGMVCAAWAPQCMTKKKWAAHCLSQSNPIEQMNPIESKSCRDALDRPDPNPAEN